ncbi:MAG: DUF3887 domain-containing protein [Cyanobium sp.]
MALVVLCAAVGSAAPAGVAAAAAGAPALLAQATGTRQTSSAQSQEKAKAAATRILEALRTRSGLGLYRQFSPGLQRMTSPALVQQRLRTMDPVLGWTIASIEPGLDSSSVATRLRAAGGERNLLLVINAEGLLDAYHLDASDEAAETVARRFVQELSLGRYVAAQSMLGPQLQQEIPAAKLQIKWQHLQRLTGDFVAIRRVVRADSTIDSKLVLVTTSFTRLSDSLFVILDASNRIVGVDFPSDPGNGTARP